MGNGLPVWLLYVQAAAVLFIAGVGAWIAFRQMQIAATKLQHGLFDRRYRVFDAARTLLAEVSIRGDSSGKALRPFILGVSDAIFLFDDALVAYLKEMENHVKSVQSISMIIESLPDDEQARASKVLNANRMWLLEQDVGLAKRFMPFMQLSKSRSPRRRWLIPVVVGWFGVSVHVANAYSYLCIAEKSAGMIERGTRWDSTTFETASKFLIKPLDLSDESTRAEYDIWEKNLNDYDKVNFTYSVGMFGSSSFDGLCDPNTYDDAIYCQDFGGIPHEEFIVNLKLMRFQRYHPFGFIFQKDNTMKLTPFIQIGTCSRL